MWLGPGLVLWAPAALGALSPLPDALSTDDLCFGLAPLQFPLADFPWFWHLWMFLDSPLWLKFHLPNFMQWPWRALFQGASPSPPPPNACTQPLLKLWCPQFQCPSCFYIFHAYKNSAVWMMLPALLALDVACPSWIPVAVASVSLRVPLEKHIPWQPICSREPLWWQCQFSLFSFQMSGWVFYLLLSHWRTWKVSLQWCD